MCFCFSSQTSKSWLFRDQAFWLIVNRWRSSNCDTVGMHQLLKRIEYISSSFDGPLVYILVNISPLPTIPLPLHTHQTNMFLNYHCHYLFDFLMYQIFHVLPNLYYPIHHTYFSSPLRWTAPALMHTCLCYLAYLCWRCMNSRHFLFNYLWNMKKLRERHLLKKLVQLNSCETGMSINLSRLRSIPQVDKTVILALCWNIKMRYISQWKEDVVCYIMITLVKLRVIRDLDFLMLCLQYDLNWNSFGSLFSTMQDGHSNDRKIAKLCEYASKNPFRIPKVRSFVFMFK